MKSLSLAKPLIIMVVGLPGAGKSFFAQQFSETFGAPVVSFDKVYSEIAKEYAQGPKLYSLVQRIVGFQIEEFVKTDKTFIVDGGVSSKTERLAVRKFASKCGYDTMIIWVQTDMATCQHRALKRAKNKNDDKFSVQLSAEAFTYQAKRLAQPSLDENVVVISGKHTYSAQVKIVLRKLAQPRESQSTDAVPITNNSRSIMVSDSPPSPPQPQPIRRNVIIS